MSFLTILNGYKLVILFYLIIIAIVYFNRKKFEFQAKFIALYRTKIGIKLMHKIADVFGPFIRGFGYVGVFIGYAGMALIVFFLFEGLYKLIFIPEAPATLSPVIPGVPIPGSPIFVPFWYGILALFVVVVVHEFSHGVVSAAHKIKVKHSGIVFFGPLIGAFVEPDEKQLTKKSWWAQQSMFAAGPVSNGVLSLLVVLILFFIMTPVMNSMVESTGFSFYEVTEGFPAKDAGLEANVVYTFVNNMSVTNGSYLDSILKDSSPGDTISIGNENSTYIITLTSNPEDSEKAFLGIKGLKDNNILKDESNLFKYSILSIIGEFLFWVFMLSLGIGLANLLPLGPVDGGRMLNLSLQKWLGDKKALIIFSKISFFLLLLIIILVFVPIFRAVFFG